MHITLLIPLLITLLIVTAVVAGYATVVAAYWFEMRSTERHGGRQNPSLR